MKKILMIITIITFSINVKAQLFQEGFHIPGTMSASAAFGDFDGDGDLDIILGDTSNTDKIWLNNGDTTFTLYDEIGTNWTNDVEVTDFENDGDIDLIIGREGTNYIWYNDGNANFTQGPQTGSGNLQRIIVSDFNEDGYPDLFFGNYNISEVDKLYISNGDGTVSYFAIPWTTGASTTDAGVADVNNDGHQDIIIARGNAPLDDREENEIWFGNGDGDFYKSPQNIIQTPTYSLAVGDYNNDGFIDLIFEDVDILHGYINDGSSYFQAFNAIYAEPSITDIDLVDIDVDGDLDLVIARFAGSDGYQSVVLFNDGDGNFNDGSEEFSMSDTFEIEYVDIDQDNDMDLFTVNKNYSDSVFWINQTNPPLGINDVSEDQFLFYPNPVKDILTIDNTSTTEITSIKIYDVLGRFILTKKEDVNQIDISHLNSGLLFVKIETEQGVVTKKIIKQ